MDAIKRLEALKKFAAEICKSECESAKADASRGNDAPPDITERLAMLKIACLRLKYSLTNNNTKVRMNMDNSRHDDDTARWVTLENGARVQLGDDGTIKAGMGGKFNGQTMGEAFGGGCTYYYDDDPANTPCKPGDPLPESLRSVQSEAPSSAESGALCDYDPFPNRNQMNGPEIEGFLKTQGFSRRKKSGGDGKWENPELDGTITVPSHGSKDIKKGTLASIKKQYINAISSKRGANRE